MSKKISELTAAGALTGTEQVEVVQSSASRRTTAQDIADLAGSGISGLTTGRLPKAASSTSIDDSVVHQNSTSIGIGTTSPDRKFHVEEDSATTNAVSYVQRLTSTSSGTPANGIGVGVEFEVETSAGNNEVGAAIDTSAVDVTGGSEDFQLSFKLMTAGAAAAEVGRFEGGASAGNLTLGGTSGGGNLTLGRASVTSGATRQIIAAGSEANINIQITDKGSGGFSVFSQSGNVLLSTSNSAETKVRASTSATNTVTNHLVVERICLGTAATGIGAGIAFSVENVAAAQITGATIETVSTDITAGSEDFDLIFKTMAAGAAAVERLKISSGGNFTVSSPSGFISLLSSESNFIVQFQSLGQMELETALTNTVGQVLDLMHTTSGTPANGIGTGLAFSTETSSGNVETGAVIQAVATDVTSTSEDFDLVFKTMAAGSAAAEAVRIKSDKSTTFTGPAVLPSYTVAGVPAAGSYTGGMIYVSNETGGAVPAFSDGTNWRRVTDRAIIS